MVVHFNWLKPCTTQNFTQMQGRKTSQLSAETETTQPSQLADEEPLIEEVWTPLLEQTSDPDHQPSIKHPEQLQGGAVWGGRLRRNVHPPKCFRPGTVATQ